MCIMEVRAGQRSSTIAQAMAHNVGTIERDLDMFVPLLEARGEVALLKTIEEAHEAMKVAYARFLDCFKHEIEHEVHSGHDHSHHDDHHGHERVHPVDDDMLAEVALFGDELAAARSATAAAERYETR